MLFVTTYKLKPHMSEDEVKELMETFAEVGSAPGTIAHYVNADGGGGVVITDSDDVAANYRNTLSYTAWMELDSTVVLTVEDAVPQILDAIS